MQGKLRDDEEAVMRKTVLSYAFAMVAMAVQTGCDDNSCSWQGCARPALPIAQSVAGVWGGEAATPAPADLATSFEFDAVGPFSFGTSPRTATFSNGVAETRGDAGFYVTGDFAWHVLVGTSATVTFETLPSSLSFWVRTENAEAVSEIQIFDDSGALIQAVTPTDAFQEIVVTRAAGESFIGTFDVISTNGGDVIIDDLTVGFSSTTDAIDCVVAVNLEVACVVTETAKDQVISAAQATFQVSNVGQVSGSGTLYAVPGSVLDDGSTVAALTITGGTFIEANSLDLTVEAAGASVTVSATYDPVYERGSSLDTVAGTYTSFDIFGEPSSFAIDDSGAISAQSESGCVANGQVTIINASFNAYDVSLDVSDCAELDGAYDGLGITQDNNATDDEFPFAVFDVQTVIVGAPVK
jgi:hypothetical protein